MTVNGKNSFKPKEITGSGGGKKGSGPDDNNLFSTATARIVEVISEGPILGLVDGAKSIYFDETPLQNEDGSENFDNVNWQTRDGNPDDEHLNGSSAVETITPVNTEVKVSTGPVTRSITNPDADAVRVIIRINSLFRVDDKGAAKRTDLVYKIEVRPAGGDWIATTHELLDKKTTSAVQVSHRIELPVNGSPWDIRVTRVTPDADIDDDNLQVSMSFESYISLVEGRFTYPHSALISMEVEAESIGQSVPSRAYEVMGRIISVPDNYDPLTRTYTGIWTGSFKEAWTNNPAWIFYDLLRNDRYGLGEHISETEVAMLKWRLYTIGQYCDQLIPSGYKNNGVDVMEPRFTFNGIIRNRQEAYHALQSVTTAFRGMGYWALGQVFATADMPSDPVKLVTPANVIGGSFTYSSTALKARHSVIIVKFNNPNDFYRTDTEMVINAEAMQKYGWREKTLELLGCTSRGLAHRYGKWALDVENNETETVEYQAGFDHMDVVPGEIVSIADPRKATVRMGGRIVSHNVSLSDGYDIVEMDAEVAFSDGEDYKIWLTAPDGSVNECEVSWVNENNKIVGIPNQSFSAETNSVFIITGTDVVPRQYRILTINEAEEGIYQINALFHDQQKYDRIEQGVAFDPLPYSREVKSSVVTGLTSSEIVYVDEDGITRNKVSLTWIAPNGVVVREYVVQMDTPSETKVFLTSTKSTNFEVEGLERGEYTFYVSTIDRQGNVSAAVSVDRNATSNDGVSQGVVSNLELSDANGSTEFYGSNVRLDWENIFPVTKDGDPISYNPSVYDFNTIKVYDAATQTLLRDFQVRGNSVTYTYEENARDCATAALSVAAARSLRFDVTVTSKRGIVSPVNTISVSNPLPTPVVPEVTVRNSIIDVSPPANVDTDVRGVKIWIEKNNTFDPLTTDPKFEGSSGFFSFNALSHSTYYVRVGYFDFFDNTMSISSSVSVDTTTDIVELVEAAQQIATDAGIDATNALQDAQNAQGDIDAIVGAYTGTLEDLEDGFEIATNAQTAAEAARDQSQAFRDASQAARDAAQLAESDASADAASAEADRIIAETKAAEASGSASAASSSANLAANSETATGQDAQATASDAQAASSSATLAGQEAQAAQVERLAAETARSGAETAETGSVSAKQDAEAAEAAAATSATLTATAQRDVVLKSGNYDFRDDQQGWSESDNFDSADTTYPIVAGGFTANKAMQILGEDWIYGTPVPVDVNRTYRVRIRCRKPTGTALGKIHAGVATYDANKVLQTTSPGTHRYCAAISADVTSDGEWNIFEGLITGTGNDNHNQFRDGTVYAAPMFISNIGKDTSFVMDIDECIIEDVTSEIEAIGHANASANSATTANAAATLAGQEATVATNERIAAETAADNSAGDAAAAAESASTATSASDAAGNSASQAASSESLTTNAQFYASKLATGNLITMPDTSGDTEYWVTTLSRTEIFAATTSTTQFPEDVYLGVRYLPDAAGTTARVGTLLGPAVAVPNLTGRRIRVSGFVFKNRTDIRALFQVRQHNVDGSYAAYQSGTMSNFGDPTGWQPFSVDLAITAGEVTNRFDIYMEVTDKTVAGQYIGVAENLRVEDVTESYASEQSAAASLTSSQAAASEATNAGSSAAVATSERALAEVARGGAETAETLAITAKDNADGFAASAERSSRLAASLGMGNLIADPEINDLDTFSPNASGAVLSIITHGQSEPTNSKAIRVTLGNGSGGVYTDPVFVGNLGTRTFRATFKVRGNANDGRVNFLPIISNADGVGFQYPFVDNRVSITTTFVEHVMDFQFSNPSEGYIYPRFYADQKNNGTWFEVTDLRVEEVTQLNASIEASQTAITKATEAGQEAIAATNERVAAEVAQGLAETARSQAVTARDDADGFAISAADSLAQTLSSVSGFAATLTQDYQTKVTTNTAIAQANTELTSRLVKTGLDDDMSTPDDWVAGWSYHAAARATADSFVDGYPTTSIHNTHIEGSNVRANDGVYRVMSERNLRPMVEGQKWKATIRMRVYQNPNTFSSKLWIVAEDANGVYINYSQVGQITGLSTADGWTNWEVEFTPWNEPVRSEDAGAARWGLMFGFLGNGGDPTGGQLAVSHIKLEEISALAGFSETVYTIAEADVAISGGITTYDASIPGGLGAKVTQNAQTVSQLSGYAAATASLTAELSNGQISGIRATVFNQNTGIGAQGSLLELIGDDVVAEGTLSASRLVVADFSGNLWPNGDFRYGDLRGYLTNTTPWVILDKATAGAPASVSPTKYCLHMPENAATQRLYVGESIAVNPGDQYVLSAWVAASASSGALVQMIMSYSDGDGLYAGGAFAIFTAPNAGWIKVEQSYTIPATAVSANLSLRRNRSYTNGCFITNIEVRKKQQAATLITPNSVTTDMIAANSITAASGIIADLAVDTLQIKGNAVTIPVDAYSGVTQTIFGSATTWHGAIEATIVREGFKTRVTFSTVYASTSSTQHLRFRILRDGVVVREFHQGGDIYQSTITYNYIDNDTGTGSTVYRIECKASGTADHTLYQRFISVEQTKR